MTILDFNHYSMVLEQGLINVILSPNGITVPMDGVMGFVKKPLSLSVAYPTVLHKPPCQLSMKGVMAALFLDDSNISL